MLLELYDQPVHDWGMLQPVNLTRSTYLHVDNLPRGGACMDDFREREVTIDKGAK